MNKQSLLIIIIIILVAALGIVLWQNSKTADAPEQISNNTENTDTQTSEPDSDTAEPADVPFNENEEFEKELQVNGNNWTLWKVTVDKKEVDMSMNVPAPLTLQFDPAKNSYSGFAGCNSFSGTYSATDNNVFDFGAAASTKKACPATMQLENGIFKAFDKAVRYGIKGNQLVFTSEDGYTELVYDQEK